jgi:hypothetical protein
MRSKPEMDDESSPKMTLKAVIFFLIALWVVAAIGGVLEEVTDGAIQQEDVTQLFIEGFFDYYEPAQTGPSPYTSLPGRNYADDDWFNSSFGDEYNYTIQPNQKVTVNSVTYYVDEAGYFYYYNNAGDKIYLLLEP